MNIRITQETILKTRQHFIDICYGCIKEAQSGDVYVNDIDDYVAWRHSQITEYMMGKNDHTVTFQQRALWIQTGECRPILPF